MTGRSPRIRNHRELEYLTRSLSGKIRKKWDNLVIFHDFPLRIHLKAFWSSTFLLMDQAGIDPLGAGINDSGIP